MAYHADRDSSTKVTVIWGAARFDSWTTLWIISLKRNVNLDLNTYLREIPI